MKKLIVGLFMAGLSMSASADNVLLVGDSLMQAMSKPLASKLEQHGNVVWSSTKVGSGLINPKLADWIHGIGWLSSKTNPDRIFILLNTNDAGKPINGVFPSSPEWASLYAKKVASLLQGIPKSVEVTWVLPPAMKNPKLNEDIAKCNYVIKQVASTYNAQVVDLAKIKGFDRFYKSAIINGKVVDIRANDGIHLTGAGASYLSAWLAYFSNSDSSKQAG